METSNILHGVTSLNYSPVKGFFIFPSVLIAAMCSKATSLTLNVVDLSSGSRALSMKMLVLRVLSSDPRGMIAAARERMVQ